MFKGLVSKFIAKSLTTKIIIITSTVVIVGGAIAGAIIIPKQIEKHQEEQRQEQLRIEKEEDLANMNIVLSRDEIAVPYKGVTQGVSIERYSNLEEVLSYKEGETINKEQMAKVLTELFVESYTGGELTVDFDENISIDKRGDYPITFTVTSEKGNTKSATATISVWNYFKVSVDIEKTDITITKGTNVDLMEGVSFSSNLPKEEQGHIETTGTVDVNTVGTYTITYTYIPKDEHEGTVSEERRTYKVIEKPNVNLNTKYTTEMIENIGGELVFTSSSDFKYTTIYTGGGNGGTQKGTYTVKGNRVTLKCSDWGDEVKDIIIDNNNNTFYWDLDYENLN